MNKLLEHWFSYLIITVWVIAYLLCQEYHLVDRFSNLGMNRIGNEHYRFVTGLLVHSRILHLLANVVGLYFVGRYLEPQIVSWKLLAFSLLIGIVTNTIFASIYRNAVSIGGSPIIFSLIGLILALQMTHTDIFDLRLGSWCGNWILFYVFFANIPLFSTSFVSTVVIHVVPTVLGMVLGSICTVLKLL